VNPNWSPGSLSDVPTSYEACVDEIMRIRQELNRAQMDVIGGKLKPADYKAFEVQKVTRIHELEAQIAKLQGLV
jgi:hypothetical protein